MDEDKKIEKIEEVEETTVEMPEKDKVQHNDIVKEIEDSFIEYSLSVITARALPDLRDGLKPVHRRILYSMYESGYTPDKPHKKCARIVGDVIGKYHPHGDSSIYDAMVRMAQDFSLRYMLVDGHGNFGNINGDSAAAYRYTESRMAKISLEMIRDINKNTVNFSPNFDGLEKEPDVLPSRFPNVLVNGTTGIAVGMATNIPPHNLKEVIDGCIAYIDNPEIDTLGLMQYIKGPDFPTGGIILGNSGIKKAYETGRGSITIRSNAIIEEKHGRNYIIIDEVPYGTNTLSLKEKVADLVHNKVIEGISDYHTDLKNGLKITITLKRDANPQVVLNNLYKHTDFQTTYGILFIMLDMGVPKTLTLKEIISKYIDHQKEVIVRRTRFELEKAEKRVHILEGYKIALDNIDEVIKIIKEAESDVIAKEKLISRFGFSEIQADSILELKLRRLTGLERSKIEEELANLLKLIEELKSILASEQKVLDIIKKEMTEIKEKYGDERRTKIDMTAIDFIEDESLIPEENSIITVTEKGYIKRLAANTYKIQNRGGVGIKGMSTNEEDNVKLMINVSTHDYILFFTNKGKVYRLKGYEIPEFARQSKGLPIINLLHIEKEETVSSIIKISNDDEEYKYLLFATKKGIVKRTAIEDFANIRQTGKISITLKDDDELIEVKKTTGNNKVLLGSTNGRTVLFDEDEVRIMGRTASGVRGINMPDGTCICAEVCDLEANLLIVTQKGYGKRTFVREFRETKRGSKGVKALNVTDKNGSIVSFKLVDDEKDIVIITDSGMVIRLETANISQLSRNAQGVRLINLKENQIVSSISIVEKDKIEDNDSTIEEKIVENSDKEVVEEKGNSTE
ncbi:MAG: DNA gyrase subunit A [Bacilli bacterium]|nr:DNA gyrase subunit A [Bacilli bacterium]